MSMVMFAMICDQCGKRSEEYTPWPICRECREYICTACAWPGTHDEEGNRCLCTKCHKLDLAVAAVEDRPVDADNPYTLSVRLSRKDGGELSPVAQEFMEKLKSYS